MISCYHLLSEVTNDHQQEAIRIRIDGEICDEHDEIDITFHSLANDVLITRCIFLDYSTLAFLSYHQLHR